MCLPLAWQPVRGSAPEIGRHTLVDTSEKLSFLRKCAELPRSISLIAQTLGYERFGSHTRTLRFLRNPLFYFRFQYDIHGNTFMLPTPEFAIQRPVLHRFRHMSNPNLLLAGQIGNRAGQLQDAVIGSGRQLHLVDSGTQKHQGIA